MVVGPESRQVRSEQYKSFSVLNTILSISQSSSSCKNKTEGKALETCYFPFSVRILIFQ